MAFSVFGIEPKVTQSIFDVGHYLKVQQKTFTKDSIEKKGAHDLVSYVDKNAEQKLIDSLINIFPESGIISEEFNPNKQVENTYTWCIDPIDGTTNFVHGIPLFCISVALLKNTSPIAGWIYAPMQDEMFVAIKDKGAFLNKKPISVSNTNKLKDALFITGFSVVKSGNYNLTHLPPILEKTRGMRRLGSAALDLAYVACGRADCFYESGLNSWDVAAGKILVEEAGGKVTNHSGKNDVLFSKEILAANGLIFNDCLNFFK